MIKGERERGDSNYLFGRAVRTQFCCMGYGQHNITIDGESAFVFKRKKVTGMSVIKRKIRKLERKQRSEGCFFLSLLQLHVFWPFIMSSLRVIELTQI